MDSHPSCSCVSSSLFTIMICPFLLSKHCWIQVLHLCTCFTLWFSMPFQPLLPAGARLCLFIWLKNHRITSVGRNLEDYLIPAPLPCVHTCSPFNMKVFFLIQSTSQLSCGLVISLSILQRDNKHVHYIDLAEHHYKCAAFLAKSYLQRHDKVSSFLMALSWVYSALPK